MPCSWLESPGEGLQGSSTMGGIARAALTPADRHFAMAAVRRPAVELGGGVVAHAVAIASDRRIRAGQKGGQEAAPLLLVAAGHVGGVAGRAFVAGGAAADGAVAGRVVGPTPYACRIGAHAVGHVAGKEGDLGAPVGCV